jgi:protein-tyrosine phosphatase
MRENGSIGVLFVCLGNICRSPLAEAVFRSLVEEAGLADRFEIDSAGTSNYHAGEPPDPRTIQVAWERGVRVEHAARQVHARDFSSFDYILAMDSENLRRIQRARPGDTETEIRLLRSFDEEAGHDAEVPDPYFGGESGFEDVQDLVDRACRGLLQHLRKEHAI